jgi:Ca2+-binding EF-hand superfamily protein
MQFLFGTAPNKMHRLYAFRERGHESHLFAFRLLLLLQAIYLSVFCAILLPSVAGQVPSGVGLVVVVVGLAPLLGFVQVTNFVIRRAVHVGSVGTFRDQAMVHKVKREQKAKKAVQLLAALNALRKKMVVAAHPTSSANGHGAPCSSDAELAALAAHMPEAEQAALYRAFDLYDRDASGSLNAQELQSLMRSLGYPLPSTPRDAEVEVAAILASLNADGDGTVSKVEFVAWSVANSTQSGAAVNTKLCNLAREIFDMFDDDKSGTLTISEFQAGFVRFGIDLTDDEMIILIEELDGDHSGDISVDEFEALLQRNDFH